MKYRKALRVVRLAAEASAALSAAQAMEEVGDARRARLEHDLADLQRRAASKKRDVERLVQELEVARVGLGYISAGVDSAVAAIASIEALDYGIAGLVARVEACGVDLSLATLKVDSIAARQAARDAWVADVMTSVEFQPLVSGRVRARVLLGDRYVVADGADNALASSRIIKMLLGKRKVVVGL